MRVPTERDRRERLRSPEIVQDGRAVRPGGVGGRIPTGRLTLTPSSTWNEGSETKHVYLDRDAHLNRVLFYANTVPMNVYLPPSPTIGDTYRFVFAGTETVQFEMRNDTHVIVGPFENLLYSADFDDLRIAHAYWFNWKAGPGSAFFWERDVLGLHLIETPLVMHQWFVLSYTGRESQVCDGFIDTDEDGVYWRPDWAPPEVPEHPLTYKTCTEWMVRQVHGPCRLLINPGRSSEVPF